MIFDILGEGELVRIKNELGLSLQRNEIDANEKIKNEQKRTKIQNQYNELNNNYQKDKKENKQRINKIKIELETTRQQIHLAEQNISLLQKGNIDYYTHVTPTYVLRSLT